MQQNIQKYLALWGESLTRITYEEKNMQEKDKLYTLQT